MNAVRLLAKVSHIVLLLGMMGVLLAACGTVSTAPKPTGKSAGPSKSTPPPSLRTTLKTSDGKVLIQFTITPNRLGVNKFVVDLKDVSSGKPVMNEQAQIFTTMLDMDMATGVVILQEDGDGRYSAPGALAMDGNWDIHIQLVDSAIHVAKLHVYIPA